MHYLPATFNLDCAALCVIIHTMQQEIKLKLCGKCRTRPRAYESYHWCLECKREYEREYKKAQRVKDPAKFRKASREWRKNNPDYSNQLRAKNRARDRATRRKSYAKCKQDLGWRAIRRLRDNVRMLMKRGKFAKRETTSALIGYDIKELGAWAKANGYNPPHNHIDHKEPVAYFLRLYPNDIKRAIREAWRIDNLQILPARENIAKSDMRYGEWLAQSRAGLDPLTLGLK